ncbi:MAG TPA: DUF63 family protein [Methanoregulaceae archaeon]|nr:DUF63 family protein [Methanoregulaceae archaeon]HOV66739.1 DUF63 family protein [Methanoregulaceae archaeon]HQJ87918.1 DUF63 family protein [Methanoregulaceae archaeon]
MIREFIYKYYIDPITTGGAYTLVDTLTYALILIIAVFLIHRWMTRSGLPFDRDLLFSTLPWVVLGGLLRVLEDTGLIAAPWRYLLITPLIFFVLFFYAVLTLYLCHRFMGERGLRVYGGIGIGSSLVIFIVLVGYGLISNHLAPEVPAIILGTAALTSLALWAFLRYGLKWRYLDDRIYQVLIGGHLLDAAATSYGIDLHPLGYVEQHVVGSTLIAATGTGFVMFPLKLVVLIPGIYVLELYRREGTATSFWHLIVLAMIVVGLAPGVRDMVRMMLYV